MFKNTRSKAVFTALLAASSILAALALRASKEQDTASMPAGARPSEMLPVHRPGPIVSKEAPVKVTQSDRYAPDSDERLALSQQLRRVDTLDQAALDELKVRVGEWIKSEPAGFETEFLNELRDPNSIDLAFSVFGIDRLAEHGMLSAPVLRAVLNLKSDSEPTDAEVHMGGGARQQVELLQIHSLSLARELGARGRTRLAADAGLRQQLIDLAQNAPNLAIVRESMQTLLALGDGGVRRDLAKIAQNRSARDRFAYADLLASGQSGRAPSPAEAEGKQEN